MKSSLNTTVAVLAIASAIAMTATPATSQFVSEKGLSDLQIQSFRKLTVIGLFTDDPAALLVTSAVGKNVDIDDLNLGAISIFDDIEDKKLPAITGIINNSGYMLLVTSKHGKDLIDAVYDNVMNGFELKYNRTVAQFFGQYVYTGVTQLGLISRKACGRWANSNVTKLPVADDKRKAA